MLCILYVNIVGLCFGLVALLFERTLPGGSSRRWLWCAVIPVSVFLPGLYRVHHNWSILGALEQRSALAPGHARSLSVLDPGWWMHLESYGAGITRVWLMLSAAIFLWGLVSAWRVWRVVRLSRKGSGSRGGPAYIDGAPVVVTDQMGPATVGVWHSRVLIPRWVLALPGAQRQYVVRHEEEHRRAHDAQLLFLASLPLILAPWNLALWWQLRRLCLAVEIDCDNRVVAGLGDRTAYGELLLKVAETSSRGPRLQPAFLGGMGSLERRLTQLLAPEPLRHFQRLLVPALAIALLFVALSMPHPVLGRGHAHVTAKSGATTSAGTIH
jgi:hypothetical protein